MEENAIFEEHPQNTGDYTDYTASAWIRFANFVIDRIVFFVFILALGFISGLLGVGEFWVTLAENRLLDILVSLMLYFVFMFLQESLFRSTMGKLITGTKIISVNGSPLSTDQLFKRNISRIIPFEPLSFLGNAIGWHDTLSDTRVVKKDCPVDYSTEMD